MYRVLVDITIGVHLTFLVFVIAGGFLTRINHRFAWIHLPALLWGVIAELSSGIVCPLTTLENLFAFRAGLATYREDFVTRHLLPIIYQEGFSGAWQKTAVAAVLVTNFCAYGWLGKRPKSPRK